MITEFPKKNSGNISFLFKDTLLYGLANSFSKILTVISFPLLTRYFPVESFGKIEIFFSLANLFVIFLVFGQDSGVARFYYEYESDNKKQKQVLSLSLLIQGIAIIIILPFLFFNSNYLVLKITSNINDEKLLILVILGIPIGVLINFSANILKWTFDRKKFLLITLGSSIFYLFSLSIALIFFKPDIIDIFYIFLLVRLITSVIGLYFVKLFIVKVYDFSLLGPLLNYSIPYGLICVLTASIPSLDKYFISKYLGEYQLGIYAVAYKIASLLNYPITAFQTAWGPFFLSRFKEEKIVNTFNDILSLFSGAIFFMLLLLLFSRDLLIHFLAGEKYISSDIVIFPILLMIAINAVKDIISIGIDIALQTKYRFIAMLLNFSTVLLFIVILIKPFGIAGVAYALCAGSVVHFCFEFIVSKKVSTFNFKLSKIILTFFATLISGFLINSIFFSETYLNIIFRLFILVCFSGFIVFNTSKDLLNQGLKKLKLNFKL